MKFRSDFVTNSSSSSFVVAYKDSRDLLKDLNSLCRHYGASEYDVVEYINSLLTNVDSKENILKRCENELSIKAKFLIMREKGYDKSAKEYIKSDKGRAEIEAYVDNKIKIIEKSIGDAEIVAKVEAKYELESYLDRHSKNVIEVFDHH